MTDVDEFERLLAVVSALDREDRSFRGDKAKRVAEENTKLQKEQQEEAPKLLKRKPKVLVPRDQ